MVLKRQVAVTGAFSYSGSHIAKHFLDAGWAVITLTRNPQREHPLRSRVEAYPLDFTNSIDLEKSLRSVDTLVDTYWVRFEYGETTFAKAVENSRILFAAARAAGVRRLVHISVSKPDLDASLPYYRGKAEVEELVKNSGLSYAILRPTIVFGEEEVLINNITWLLRHFPVFTIPGDGKYRLQPISVEDMAELAVRAARGRDDEIIDDGGPEVFTYNELIHFLAKLVKSRALIVRFPPWITLLLGKMLGLILGDVVLTNYELKGLMQDRLYVGLPGEGKTKFSEWAQAHADTLGKKYVNELKRHHGGETRGY